MAYTLKQPYLTGKVEDVMTRDPVTVSEDESIYSLVDMFIRHNYHGVPVIDSGGRLVGVARDSEVMAMFVSKEPFAGRYRTVKEIMHVPPFTIGPQETIQRAALKMFVDGTRFMVVVGEKRKILGIVTRIDLIKGIRGKDSND